MSLNFEAIEAAALASLPSLLPQWFPGGVRKGHEWVMADLTGAPGRSLSININSGAWGDFSTNDVKGHGVISILAAARHGGDRIAAAKDLGAQMGIALREGTQAAHVAPVIPQPRPTPLSDWKPIAPTDIREPTAKLAKWQHVYRYNNADGTLIGYVVRSDKPDGSRDQIRPLNYGEWTDQRTGEILTGWHPKHLASPRPLYGLDLLAERPDATTFVIEGEKATDCARALFPEYVSTTWQAGCGNVAHADFSPLKGRRLIVWPDADVAGYFAAAEIIRQFPDAFCLDVIGLPVGFDAADLAAAGDPDPIAWVKSRLRPGSHITDAVAAMERGGYGTTLKKEGPLPSHEWLVAHLPGTNEEPAAGYEANAGAAAPQRPKSGWAPAASLAGYDLNEDGIALAFAAAHQETLRYDHSIGKWFHWDGTAWRRDETRLAFSWSRRTCRQLAKAAHCDGKQAGAIAKAATAAAVERFAQADPSLAVTAAIWDCDSFLLGTPGGTVDLRTGEMHPARREAYITKLAAVTPSLMPDCPKWLAFLDQVAGKDKTLIRFLQQWCGYCVTGDTREHALLFVHGPGGNGKSVFLNTISRIMGEYARNAAMDTFTASSGDKHPTDLAALWGARLVMASETEEGRAWAETRIKSLTGGDKVTARFMRQDFFEFLPAFKLTIIGNHKPVLKNVDEAARRRMNLIPFIYKPPTKDMQLEENLQMEWPGILRWMIEGCLDWQKNGLVRPDVVVNATDLYFAEQDLVNQWIEDSCTIGANQSDTMAALFRSWTDFALANGEKPGTTKWFSQTLARLGCEAVHNTPGQNGKRGFKGIAVKLVTPPDRTEQRKDEDERF